MDAKPVRRLTLVTLGAGALMLTPAADALAAQARGTTSQGFHILVRGSSRQVLITTRIQLSCTSGQTYTDGVGIRAATQGFVQRRGRRLIHVFTHNVSVSRDGPFVADNGVFLGLGTMQITAIGLMRLDPGRSFSGAGTLRPALTIPPITPFDGGNTCTAGDAPISYSVHS